MTRPRKMTAMLVLLSLLIFATGCSESKAGKTTPKADSTDSTSLWNQGINTPEALKSYVLRENDPVPGFRLGAFLGKGEVIGEGTIPIDMNVPVTKDAAYSVTFLCNPERNVPYSIGIRKDGDFRSMGYEEGCSGSIANLSMPAKMLPDATEVAINSVPDGQVIAVVFEIIQEEEQ